MKSDYIQSIWSRFTHCLIRMSCGLSYRACSHWIVINISSIMLCLLIHRTCTIIFWGNIRLQEPIWTIEIGSLNNLCKFSLIYTYVCIMYNSTATIDETMLVPASEGPTLLPPLRALPQLIITYIMELWEQICKGLYWFHHELGCVGGETRC